MKDRKNSITPLLQVPGNDNSQPTSVTNIPGGTGETSTAAGPLEAGALPSTSPGSSGATTSSASPSEAGAAIHHLNTKTTTATTTNTSFARHLVISHSDRDDDICKINPYLMQKAIEVLIGQDFKCVRHEKAKLVEINVRSKRASETLLSTKILDCTEFTVPVNIVKHRTKNTCKGVIHCGSIGKTSKTSLLEQMAEDHVVEIFRLSKTENGITSLTNSYILTFDSETPPRELDMGFGQLVPVYKHYPNPRLCRNCQGYGHGANNCKNKQRCAKCGLEGHSFGDCDKDTPCCHYCKENHPTSAKACPRYKLEKRVLKQMTDDRSSALDARKKVYRDSQDLVSLIPSLSSHVVTTYSKIVAGNPNVITAHPRNPTQPPLKTTSNPQSHDASYFDHPLFKSMMDQQKALAEQQKDLLEQQRENTRMMRDMMGLMGTMMSFFQNSLPQTHPFISQFKKIQNDLNDEKALRNSSQEDSGIMETQIAQQSTVVADETTSVTPTATKLIPNLNLKGNSRTSSKKRQMSPESEEESNSKRAPKESLKSLDPSHAKSSPKKPVSPKNSPRKLSAGPEKSPRGRSSGPKSSSRKSSPSPGKGSPRASSRGRTLERWKGERGRSGQVTGKAPSSPKVTPENGGKILPKTQS